MLKFETFQLLQKPIDAFKFQLLQLISSASLAEIYQDDKGNQYSFQQYDQIEEVKIIDSLAKKQVVLNYCGSLQKDNKFYVFYSVGDFTSLASYAENLQSRNQRVEERFCIQFFNYFLYIFTEAQKLGYYIKILTPYTIGLRSSENLSNIGFGLILPFSCKHFNFILKKQYQQNINYASPQIIRHFHANPSEEVCQKQFRKAQLFSLGLSLLLCFGYSFTAKQRIQASRNDKQFRSIFKKIRKQIKIIHGGKYVPKVLKLLLQDCQKSRQIVQTLGIKLNSFQFESLKICKDIKPTEYKFITTISDSVVSAQKSQKMIKQQIEVKGSPFSITPTSNHTGKSISASSYMRKKQQKQKQKLKQKPVQSPINIQVSQSEQTPQQYEKDNHIQGRRRMYAWLQSGTFNHNENSKVKMSNSQKYNQQHINYRQERQYEQPIQMQKIVGNNMNCIVHNTNSEQIGQQVDSHIYRYNIDQLGIGKYTTAQHNKFQKMGGGKMEQNVQSSIFMGQFAQADQEVYDEKSILRRKFYNQSKIIMAIIIASFFVYGLVGYLRQDYA